MFNHIYNGWKLAWSYFTIIPISFDENVSFNEVVYRYMLLFFPLVGAILALIASIIYSYIFFDLNWLGALIGASIYMMLYGFLHTEAVADIADAIYASHSGKDSYEVIKDPTIGAMGLFWGMIVALLKLASITYLFLNLNPYWLIVVAISSRVALLGLIKLNQFRSSFVLLLKSSLNLEHLLVGVFLYTILLVSIFGEIALIYLVVSVITSLILSNCFKNSLGFINGDVLGATLEIAEIATTIGILLWH